VSENLEGNPESASPAPNPSAAQGAADSGGAPAVPTPSSAETAPEPSSPETGAPDEAAGAPDGERRPRRRRRRRGRRGGGEPGAPGANEGEAQAPAQPRHEQQGQQRPQGQRHGRQQHQHGGRRYGRQESEHHALQALRSLSTMAEGLLEVEGIEPFARPRYLEIKIQVPLDMKRDGLRAAASAVGEILQRVGEVREHEKALKPGAVYCYFSNSAEGESSRSSDPRHVFEGYASTGKPNFVDFLTTAVERKYTNFDRLAAGEDVIVTHVTMGRVLRTQQLVEFGKTSPVYKILGQVDAGLFPLVNSDKKAAFSFQLLRGTTLEGRPRLRMHTVGAADLMDIADQDVALILSRFQHRLDQESLRLAGKQKNGDSQGDDAEEEFILPILQDLARQIAGNARRSQRRTEHAEQRTEQGNRPTSKAFEDARDATDRDLLWDDIDGTVVALGPKGRVHVFTPEAKHVTSLVMDGAQIQSRVKQGRWREAEPDERGSFRMRLRRQLDQGAVAQADAASGGAPAAPVPTA